MYVDEQKEEIKRGFSFFGGRGGKRLRGSKLKLVVLRIRLLKHHIESKIGKNLRLNSFHASFLTRSLVDLFEGNMALALLIGAVLELTGKGPYTTKNDQQARISRKTRMTMR